MLGIDSAVSGIFGIGASIYNNEQAKQREAQARRENYIYGEYAANNADARTRALYGDLYSPQAQMQQIREAGLSPSLFYGDMAGISGQSGAQGTGAAGISPTTFGIDPMMAAQIALMDAQTKKTEAEADIIKPTADATISNLLADAGHKNAAAAAAKAQATSVELDNYVKENTKDASIFKICELAEQAAHEAEKTLHEMRQAKLLADFNEETFNKRKEIMSKQLEQIVQSIAESKSTENLNNQKRAYFKDAILQSISQTQLEWAKYELNYNQFETFIEKQIPILEKEIDVKLGELEIRNKEFIKDAIIESFKAAAMGVIAVTSVGVGKGSQTTPMPNANGKTFHTGGNAKNKGVPVYKQGTVWEL